MTSHVYKYEVFMNNVSEVSIGVDISKSSLDIALYPSGEWLKIANTKLEITKFVKRLSQYDVKQVACEATGGYEKLLVKLLKQHSYSCWIVDPRRIKGFITASGCKNKTDKIDAQKIAEFASKNSPDYEPICRTSHDEMLRALVSRRQDLTKTLAEEKTRLKHSTHELSVASIERMILFLNKEIKTADKQLSTLIAKDTELQRKAGLLESIPGVGQTSATLLLSFVPELGTLSNNEIAALVGVCPYSRESGNYIGKRFIRGGRVIPRNALYMCALTTIRLFPPLKAFYDRLIANKKCFKVAIVSVMRKLIILANVILKNGEPCKA